MRATLFPVCGAVIAAFFVSTPCGAQFTPLYSGSTGLENVGNYSFAAWGDYDNDGFLDLFLSGYSAGGVITRLYHNNSGDDTFTDSGMEFFWGHPGVCQVSADFGDYDNDGFLDLVMQGTLNCGGITRVFHNNQNGTFSNLNNAGVQAACRGDVEWGDCNNDGKMDILITSGQPVFAALYRNNGNSTFTDMNAGITALHDSSCAWGDYNNDGYSDFIISGWDIGCSSLIYRRNLNGTFTDINAGLAGVSSGESVWGDYDNDGNLDLMVTGEDYFGQNCYYDIVYHNNGNGTFTDIGAGLPGLTMSSAAWGDYDSDGNIDLLVTGYDGQSVCTRIYRNGGNGVFSAVILPGLFEVYNGAGIWGDYNNDGALDFLATGNHGANLKSTILYRNDGPASWVNDRPSAPGLVTPPGASFLVVVTLQWNPVTTDETPAAAMTYNLRVGTSPGGCDVVSADTDDTHPSHNKLLGNVQNGTYAKLRNLPQGTYYWAVQAVDGGYRRSEWSREGTFVRTNDVSIQPSLPITAEIMKPTPVPTSVSAEGWSSKRATAPTPTPTARGAVDSTAQR